MSFTDLYNANLARAFYHDGDAYREPFDHLDGVSYSFFCLEDVLASPPAIVWKLAA